MDDYDFVNEDFFNQWKERTNQRKTGSSGKEGDGHQGKQDDLNFDGRTTHASIEVMLQSTLFHSQTVPLTYTRNSLCQSCDGSRESEGPSGKGSTCYACKGSGIRKDPLFHKE